MDIKLTVPDNKLGKWEIKSFKLTEAQVNYHNAREAVGKGQYIQASTVYKKLIRYEDENLKEGVIIKSNTSGEVAQYLPFIQAAEGNVLIFGLGMGMLVQALIDKEKVSTITVIEADPDLINLCGAYYMNSSAKVIVIRSHAFAYSVSGNYNAIWFDIWDRISETNVPEMQNLKSHWNNNAPVIMCWAEKECNAIEKQLKASEKEHKAIENEHTAMAEEAKSVLDSVKNKYKWW